MFVRFNGTSGQTWPTLGITVEPGDVVEIDDAHARSLDPKQWEVLEGDRTVLGSGVTVDTLVPTGRAPGEAETVALVRVLADGADPETVMRVVVPPAVDGATPREYVFASDEPVQVHEVDVAELVATGAFALVDEGGEPVLYGDLTKVELQELLAARDLPTSGTKDELIARLRESDLAAAGVDEPEPTDPTY